LPAARSGRHRVASSCVVPAAGQNPQACRPCAEGPRSSVCGERKNLLQRGTSKPSAPNRRLGRRHPYDSAPRPAGGTLAVWIICQSPASVDGNSTGRSNRFGESRASTEARGSSARVRTREAAVHTGTRAGPIPGLLTLPRSPGEKRDRVQHVRQGCWLGNRWWRASYSTLPKFEAGFDDDRKI